MRSALRAALVGAAVLIAGDVYAQAFPAKTVRFVIPFPVGGSSDANARIIIPPRWRFSSRRCSKISPS